MFKSSLTPGMLVWYRDPVPKKILDQHRADWDLTGNHVVMIIGREEWNRRIQCVLTTSQLDAPGFELSICNDANPKKTIITPYNIINLKVEFLGDVLGFVPIQLYQAVLSAVSFHLGFNNEVPPYLKHLENDYYTVHANYGTRKPMEYEGFYTSEVSIERSRRFLTDERIPGNAVYTISADELHDHDPVVIEAPKNNPDQKHGGTKADSIYANLTEKDKVLCIRIEKTPTALARTLNLNTYFAKEMVKRVKAEYSSAINNLIRSIQTGATDIYNIPNDKRKLLEMMSVDQWNEIGIDEDTINSIFSVYSLSRI